MDALKGIDIGCGSHQESCEDWQMADDLCGGTKAMRTARDKYLPTRSGEDVKQYEFRLQNAFLYPGFAGTIGDLTSRPFERDIVLVGAGENEELIAGNVDRMGTALTEHALDRFTQALKYGASIVLVDFRGDGKQSAKDEMDGASRAYFVPISPKDLLDWSYNDHRLTMIRFRRTSEEPDGEFGKKTVNRIVVWQLNDAGQIDIRRWRKAENGEAGGWIEEESRVATALTPFRAIPLDVVWFGEPNGLAARTPLFDLMWKNVEHYQSAARRRYSLEYASAGLLTIIGLSNKELEEQGGVSIGGSRVLCIPRVDGDAKYAETSGAALDASKQDCDDILQQMRQLGTRHMEERSRSTATAERNDESRASSNVKQWIRLMQAGIRRCFEMAAAWRGETLASEFQVQIFSDFSPLTDSSMDAVAAARMTGDISQLTYLKELQRRGFLDANLDLEEEIDATERARGEFEDAHAEAPKTDGDDIEEDDEEDDEEEDERAA